MRKVKGFLVLVIFLTFLFQLGCASETPWRKAAVTTYELVGIGIGATKDTTESLKAQGFITEEQVAKVKDAYNKARTVYISAGNTLKLASKAVDAASRDALLTEYDRLLTDFRKLAYELYDLMKGFKKVSYNEILLLIENGGEV